MDNLIAPSGIKQGIFRCLKAGVNPEFPEQGTCQGGVVSPLLANIALNGIEEIHQSVRYADDMVIILKPTDDATKILEKISQFLEARGLKVSEKKTKLTATTDGFDFLGWHFKVQSNGKFRSTPSADNYKKFRQKVKAIVNCSNYGAKVKAQKLAPIIRGWRNYHRFCKMDGSRFSLWHIRYRTWKVFNKETKLTRESTTKLIEKAFPSVPYSENKYVNVKGNKSPYDGDISYWSERNSKLYDGETSKALNRQNHTCGHCGLKFTSEERVHLHHIDGNHDNWKPNNLIAIHESCHDYTHMGKSAS
ncbi:reverse transcriptase homolog [Calothrix sp. NIES-4071]|nr:reverse transcriptase homolog [Calothrix sp. NIES-4071]BAZ17289.1 reverse transcriptase homolog [Calothrix sp. NIES-4071]BAZ60310.1 reverse transcriptase homolog [Calothrix sp. NIES-4105]BAZ63434.1 reverse transcriptase homolog [Calothrix sp. NIES-4105]